MSISEVFCAAAPPIEAYLVVGSNKVQGQLNSPCLESYHHSPELDFTHTRTFGGLATTLDLRSDTNVPGRHIHSTNICEYTPEKPIAAVFMELFPSEGVRTVLDLQRMTVALDPALKKKTIDEIIEKTAHLPPELQRAMLSGIQASMNEPYTIDYFLMPRAIKNLAKYMPSGAKLYIEHIPLYSKNPRTAVKNPFSFYVYPLFPDLLRASTALDSETVWNDATVRLSSQSTPLEEIERLIAEGKAKQELCKQAIVLVQAAMAKATGAIQLSESDCIALLNTEISCFGENFLSKLPQFHLSLSVLVSLELERLEQSRPDSPINRFLTSQGFTDIRHERIQNPFNGRSNSWIINATKG